MITIIYDRDRDIKENVLEPVKFTNDAIYLNLFYHKITSDRREIADYVSFNKHTKKVVF